jgi:hypothetical protein
MTTIKEIRILPPLAIARFGSSPEPLENYSLEVNPEDPAGFRLLKPAATLLVNLETGEIDAETDPSARAEVAFRDSQRRVKPLCPFLEVWAKFSEDGPLEPLTIDKLAEGGTTPADLHWQVSVGNLKVFRRTGDPRDRVVATTGIFTDHGRKPLNGQCPNFKPGKQIPFGFVQYIKPNANFPEIRFRFTPGQGHVFGPRVGDHFINDDVYDGFASRGGNAPGRWDRYWPGKPRTPLFTAPADIFQGQEWDFEELAVTVTDSDGAAQDAMKVSDGYFDDTCDGIVEVRLRGTNLSAFARIMAAMPHFSPDSRHLRTIADDIEQMALGPDVDAPVTPGEKEDLRQQNADIVRRALETVRLMNTMVQNGDQGVGGVSINGNNMAGQQTGSGRFFEPIFPTGSADYRRVLRFHRTALIAVLNAQNLDQPYLPFVPGLMRQPEAIGDLTDAGRRRMPAMMRGSDSLELTLTRRQLGKLELASPTIPPVPLAAPLALAAAAAVTGGVDKAMKIPVPPTHASELDAAVKRLPADKEPQAKAS